MKGIARYCSDSSHLTIVRANNLTIISQTECIADLYFAYSGKAVQNILNEKSTILLMLTNN